MENSFLKKNGNSNEYYVLYEQYVQHVLHLNIILFPRYFLRHLKYASNSCYDNIQQEV